MQGVLPTVYRIKNFGINSEWKQARQPDPSRWKKKKLSSDTTDPVLEFLHFA
jgi:hypothetical protein